MKRWYWAASLTNATKCQILGRPLYLMLLNSTGSAGSLCWKVEIKHTSWRTLLEDKMFFAVFFFFFKQNNWNLFPSMQWQMSTKAIKHCHFKLSGITLKLTSDFPRLKQAPLVNSSQCHSASCRERGREGEKQRKFPNKPSRHGEHHKHLVPCHHEPLWKPLREPKQNNAWLSTVAKFPPFWSHCDGWWLCLRLPGNKITTAHMKTQLGS